MPTPRITIAGAGLGGSLLAIYLARRGDLRREPVETGRSIKLTLAERGGRWPGLSRMRSRAARAAFASTDPGKTDHV